MSDSPLMGDPWVNAVIEIRIPLDAGRRFERGEVGAVADAMDRVQMPDTAVAACRFEDGEPISE